MNYEKCLERAKKIAQELELLVEDEERLRSYFDDALDIEYRIGGGCEYRSVAITITSGGPHIEIDTGDRAVKIWWNDEKAQWSINVETVDVIDAIFSSYYEECIRK